LDRKSWIIENRIPKKEEINSERAIWLERDRNLKVNTRKRSKFENYRNRAIELTLALGTMQ